MFQVGDGRLHAIYDVAHHNKSAENLSKWVHLEIQSHSILLVNALRAPNPVYSHIETCEEPLQKRLTRRREIQ